MNTRSQPLSIAPNCEKLSHPHNTCVVHKFGGSSLTDTFGCKHVVNKIKLCLKTQPETKLWVVVSANGNRTDQLLALKQTHYDQNALNQQLVQLSQQQCTLATSLLSDDQAAIYNAQVAEDIQTIQAILYESRHEKDLPVPTDILAFGELWSARLISACLNKQGLKSVALDARAFLRFDETNSSTLFNAQQSHKELMSIYSKLSSVIPVVTGYIARNNEEQTITLGRNGSDYSAALLAQLLGASNVKLWTDVDGVYALDPARFPFAQSINHLTYKEANLLAGLNSPVFHRNTISPLNTCSIPLTVACSASENGHETCVSLYKKNETGQTNNPKVITACEKVILIDLHTTSLEAHTIKQCLQACYTHGIDILACQIQTNSAQLAILPQQNDKLRSVLKAFPLMTYSELEKTVQLVAVIGENIAKNTSLTTRFYHQLSTSGASLLFSEHKEDHCGLIAVVQHSDIHQLQAALYQSLISKVTITTIGIIGPGAIGSKVYEIINALPVKDKHYQVKGIARSSSTLISATPISLEQWHRHQQTRTTPHNLCEFSQQLRQQAPGPSIIIDTSASAQVASLYHHFIEDGHHLVSANKLTGSGCSAYYHQLKKQLEQCQQHWLYETTVGAGLPVTNTIKRMISTGDNIKVISGVFSGSLSWIFQHLAKGLSFYQCVKQAAELSMTEPDPREDLSGKDVARKLVILAREAGYSLTLEDVRLPKLLPESWYALSIDAFWQRLKKDGEQLITQFSVQPDCEQLAIVATFSAHGKSGVTVKTLPTTHDFTQIKASDNIFKITSDYYQHLPLIIRGPGAGIDVTASGVVADMLAI